jgi:hypothetical protein
MHIILTEHAKKRLLERGICMRDIKRVIFVGELLMTKIDGVQKIIDRKSNLIVICKTMKNLTIIITAYYV